MAYLVYMAKNKENGLLYIGSTSQGLETRRKYHFYIAKRMCSKNRWWKAVRKYGEKAFEWKELDKAKTRKSLHEKEKKWIRLLKTNDPKFGYNKYPAP